MPHRAARVRGEDQVAARPHHQRDDPLAPGARVPGEVPVGEELEVAGTGERQDEAVVAGREVLAGEQALARLEGAAGPGGVDLGGAPGAGGPRPALPHRVAHGPVTGGAAGVGRQGRPVTVEPVEVDAAGDPGHRALGGVLPEDPVGPVAGHGGALDVPVGDPEVVAGEARVGEVRPQPGRGVDDGLPAGAGFDLVEERLGVGLGHRVARPRLVLLPVEHRREVGGLEGPHVVQEGIGLGLAVDVGAEQVVRAADDAVLLHLRPVGGEDGIEVDGVAGVLRAAARLGVGPHDARARDLGPVDVSPGTWTRRCPGGSCLRAQTQSGASSPAPGADRPDAGTHPTTRSRRRGRRPEGQDGNAGEAAHRRTLPARGQGRQGARSGPPAPAQAHQADDQEQAHDTGARAAGGAAAAAAAAGAGGAPGPAVGRCRRCRRPGCRRRSRRCPRPCRRRCPRRSRRCRCTRRCTRCSTRTTGASPSCRRPRGSRRPRPWRRRRRGRRSWSPTPGSPPWSRRPGRRRSP